MSADTPSGAIVVELPKATQDQLDRLEGHLQRINGRLTKLEEQRIPKIEEELRGAEDARLRDQRPGLIATVETHDGRLAKIERARGEAEAVAKTKRMMIAIGATVIGAQVAMITLMLRIAGVI